VAPLKPPLGLLPTLAYRQFPRLQKRGPIEAFATSLTGHSTTAFPRLQKRGPIEAQIVGQLAPQVLRGFHAYKSVAPLKHSFYILARHGAHEVSTLTKAWPH